MQAILIYEISREVRFNTSNMTEKFDIVEIIPFKVLKFKVFHRSIINPFQKDPLNKQRSLYFNKKCAYVVTQIYPVCMFEFFAYK